MYFLAGLIIFFILAYSIKKYNEKANNAFIAESAPDQKETEIGFFWKRIKSASTKTMKEEVIISQSLYWYYYQKAKKRKYFAFTALIIGLVVEYFMY